MSNTKKKVQTAIDLLQKEGFGIISWNDVKVISLDNTGLFIKGEPKFRSQQEIADIIFKRILENDLANIMAYDDNFVEKLTNYSLIFLRPGVLFKAFHEDAPEDPAFVRVTA